MPLPPLHHPHHRPRPGDESYDRVVAAVVAIVDEANAETDEASEIIAPRSFAVIVAENFASFNAMRAEQRAKRQAAPIDVDARPFDAPHPDKPCSECKGDCLVLGPGAKSLDDGEPCPACGGTGVATLCPRCYAELGYGPQMCVQAKGSDLCLECAAEDERVDGHATASARQPFGILKARRAK